jgi:hypothetical protein
MVLAREHCSQGLVSRRSPARWKVVDASPSTIGEFVPDRPTCIRLIVVVTDAGQSARASIVDNRGGLIASASGPKVLLVPADGPLCVPSEILLRFELTTPTPPAAGIVAVLESL